jgi:hypothetical protein
MWAQAARLTAITTLIASIIVTTACITISDRSVLEMTSRLVITSFVIVRIRKIRTSFTAMTPKIMSPRFRNVKEVA